MRDRELVQRIKDATDLVALVGQAVKLRKQGSAWVGLCPFHSERSPSFQVVADRGFYHCFGCGKHGDALSWLQEREGMTFGEALEHLAGQAGIDMPKVRERSTAEVAHEDRLREVLGTAQAYFQSSLRNAAKPQAYLEGRGMKGLFLEESGVGFAPEGWENLVEHLRKQGYSPDLIEQSGLASRSERGRLIDFLRNRITIPIHDARGRLVGFGGRCLGDEKPKYLNTRETQLFNKGHVLFGFHRAKGAFRDGALVVEGYFDVLTLHQEGIQPAVAPLGTALTENHLQLIQRFTKRLVLCFDGDAAGIRAMEKALKMSLPMGFDVRLLLLPSGEDPDTWCMRLGPQAFQELMVQAPDWTSFLLEQSKVNRDMKKAFDRMEIFKIFVGHFVYLPRTPENWSLLQSVAHELQIPRHEVNRALDAQRSQLSLDAEVDDVPTPLEPEMELDELLRPILVLCQDKIFREQFLSLPSAWWENLSGSPLLQCVLEASGDDGVIPEGALAQIRRLEAQWAAKDDAELQSARALQKLEMDFVQREIQMLKGQLLDPGAMADPRVCRVMEKRLSELLARKTELQRQQRTLRV